MRQEETQGHNLPPIQTQRAISEHHSPYMNRYDDEFVDDILNNGLADGYSFDHDLADFHYDIKADVKTEKTGYHCAKWLIEHCMDKNIMLPKTILIHSMNVQGSINIKSLFDSYQKSLTLPSSRCIR
jgi:hypothetical protein